MTFWHAGTDFVLEFSQIRWLLRRRQLLQMRCPVVIDAQFGVDRKPGVDLGGRRLQFVFQRGDEILALSGIPRVAQ